LSDVRETVAADLGGSEDREEKKNLRIVAEGGEKGATPSG
jgi:hypothetical protein